MSVPIINLNEYVDHRNSKVANNHPLLPQHDNEVGSFRWLISGKSGTGKTNLILSALLQNQIRFDKIYLVVKSPDQPKYKLFLKWINTIEKDLKKQGIDVDICEVITEAENMPDIEDIDASLINVMLFDDMLLSKGGRDMIPEYFIRGRHKGINCIYLTQDYHKTDVTIRKQCDYFSVFGVSSKAELIQLSKEHSLTHDYTTFKNILTEATKKTNDFLFIDRRTSNKLLQLRKNYDEFWDESKDRFVSVNEIAQELK